MKGILVYFQLLFFASFLFVGGYSQSCSYSNSGYTLSLTPFPLGLEWLNVTSPYLTTYMWNPCVNGIVCGSVYMMASQSSFFQDCEKLAVWDSSVPGSYNVNNRTWTMEFNNGGPCGSNNVPRTTIFYLTCINGTSAYDQIALVTNPNGGCTFYFYVSGPSFCAAVSTSSSKSVNSALVAGIVIPLVLILLCIVGGLVYRHRRNSKSNVPNEGLIPQSQPQQSYQAVSNE